MHTLTNFVSRNQLLASLSASDLELIRPHLEPVDLSTGTVLTKPGELILDAYFIESGIASVISLGPNGRRIETGLIGREGFVGTALLLDVDRVPYEIFVQLQGTALQIKATNLLAIIEASPTIRSILARYVQTFITQTAYTALTNGRDRIEERLARWLVMYRDRVDGDSFEITHHFLAMMLAVRRPGITVAMEVLEGKHLIKATRGRVTILDRRGLISAASKAYGAPEAEYDRLIGSWRRKT